MKNIKIGKRNIKTAISVFLALSIYIVLYLIDYFIGNDTESFVGLTAIYTPFYAAIAAAYTSHRDFKSSLNMLLATYIWCSFQKNWVCWIM